MATISFLQRLFDLLFPSVCVICGGRLAVNERYICGKCNLHLPRTNYADDAYDNEMAQLFWGRLPIERSAAWFFYQPHSQVSSVIYNLKYNNHPEIGEQFGRLVAQEFLPKGFFEGIDIIVPVPLTKKRKLQRGYNQSMEIAIGVSDITHIPIAKKALRRYRFTESQTKKQRSERVDNVEGAFELVDSDALNGKHILIIDDIVTTGATVNSCGTEIAHLDNVRISVLSLGFTKS